MTSLTQSFPATSKGARAARLFATDVVGANDGLGDQVALVVSELAANAVLHAATPFSVTVCDAETGIRIEVADGNPAVPQLKAHENTAPTGRGLRIVEQLADRWGVRLTGSGKVVWVEIQPDRQAVR